MSQFQFLHALRALVASLLLSLTWAIWKTFVQPRYNPLRILPGPPVKGLWGTHMGPILDPARSPKTHEIIVRDYGRHARVRGLGPWDERLFTLDPISMAHIMKRSDIYEKPWQSRSLITGLIGCGMLAAEGVMHKRQRRVASPAFSLQNLRALVPLVFKKGTQLRDTWIELLERDIISNDEATVSSLVNDRLDGVEEKKEYNGVKLDVAMWVSRATFDVIGLAGFEYNFDSIRDESNELFVAYKDMFETAISQNNGIRTLLGIYIPIFKIILPDPSEKTVNRCQAVIQRVAGKLLQEKKAKIAEAEKSGKAFQGRDLLSLLLKSNVATDLSPEQRISDEDILHNINTFMFAGSDTTSLALTWTLLLLAQNPEIQTRLRNELLQILPPSTSTSSSTSASGTTQSTFPDYSALSEEEIGSLYTVISEHPLLNNVCKESLRLIPPVHSSLRVATQDDVVPTLYPVMHKAKDGKLTPTDRKQVFVPKGTFVHVPIEAFNLDRHVWGQDAWKFNPDRWDTLSDAAKAQPGVYANVMTFSAGPRSCIGQRFSMIEMKSFLYIFLSSFEFLETEEQVYKANVVLTRPYVKGKFTDGSQCPLYIRPYRLPA